MLFYGGLSAEASPKYSALFSATGDEHVQLKTMAAVHPIAPKKGLHDKSKETVSYLLHLKHQHTHVATLTCKRGNLL